MAKIEKLSSGAYRIRVYLGRDANGKKHWKSFTDTDRKRLQRIAAEYSDTHRIYTVSETFRKDAAAYIEIKRPVLSPNTIRTYEDILAMLEAKFAHLCDTDTAEISSRQLQTVVNTLVTSGRAPKYVRNIYGFITAVMNSAGASVPSVTLPEKKRPELYQPSTEDIERTIKAAAGTALEIPILLGVHGLRRGEICALHYPEDFNGNIVHVRRSMVYLGAGERIEKTPKNIQSDRFVPLDPALLDMISAQGYVVRCTPQTLTGSFRKLLKRNGLPMFRFHDLRHYFVAYMHSQGFSDAEIMQMGGWQTDHVMKEFYRYCLDNDTTRRMQEAMSRFTVDTRVDTASEKR